MDQQKANRFFGLAVDESAFLRYVLLLLLIGSGCLLFRFPGKPKARASSDAWLFGGMLFPLTLNASQLALPENGKKKP